MPAPPVTPTVVFESAAEVFEEEYRDVPAPGPNNPQVLFRSSLSLTRDREDMLCAHLKDWYRRLNDSMGREDTSLAGINDMGSFFSNLRTNREERGERRFFEKRLLYQRISENNLDHRAELEPDSIFAKSNLVVPLARRISTQMAARANNYFFGTDPWLAQYPVGAEDKLLAQQLQKLTEAKFSDSGSIDALRRAVSHAFIVGESVMKVTQVHEQDFYRETLVCAVDGAGNPLVAADGEPITPADTFSMVEDPAAPPGTGSMVAVLDRDKQTPVPDAAALVFKEVTLDRQITHYKGPRAAQVHWRDFLCPTNAPSVQEAECCIHVIERTPSQIVQTYVQASGGQENIEEIRRAVEAVRDALGGYEHSQTGDRSARPELGEVTDYESPEKISEYGEFYCRFDADGDLVQEDIMCVMNLRTGFPIFYDYVANVTANKRRPFVVIRPKAVINRWYGQGAIEQFELHQETVDLMVNRRNFNQSGSGRVVIFNPLLTLEGQANPNLTFNWGATYTPISADIDPKKIVHVEYIEDNKSNNLTQELEFFMQLAMNESGVQHANDGNTAGADSTKLATGIRNIEKSGQELFGVVISELDGGVEWGITGVAQAFTTTLYANLDDDETFDFFEGEFMVAATVAASQVKHLRMNVRTLLTRYRDEQVIASSTQATMLIEKFYSLPGPLQGILAGMFRDQLRALQIPRADDYIIPQEMPLIAPQGMPDTQAVGNPPKQAPPLL